MKYNFLLRFLDKVSNIFKDPIAFAADMGFIKCTAGFGTGHGTVTTYANYLPIIWSKEIQIAVEENLVFAKRVMRIDKEVMSKGASVYLPHFTNPSATAKAASTAVTFQGTVTESKTTLTIDQHWESSYLLEDIVDIQSYIDFEPILIQKAGYALSEKIDTTVGTLAASFSQEVGTENTDEISDANILRSVQYLDDANAPRTDRSLIIKPVLRTSMLALDKFTSTDYRTDNTAMTGVIGQVYGVPVFVSTNVWSVGDQDNNCMIHKEAIALAMQKSVSVEKGRVIEYISDAIVAHALWGVTEYRDTFGVRILS